MDNTKLYYTPARDTTFNEVKEKSPESNHEDAHVAKLETPKKAQHPDEEEKQEIVHSAKKENPSHEISSEHHIPENHIE